MYAAPSLAIALVLAASLGGCSNSTAPEAANGPSAAASQSAATPQNQAMPSAAAHTWVKLPTAALDAAKSAGTCSIDIVNDAIAAPSTNIGTGQKLSGSGWVAESSNAVPAQFKMILKGETIYSLASNTGVSRPDVAKVLGTDDAKNAGFKFDAPLDGISPGTYEVFTLASNGETQEMCDTKHQFVVGS